MQNDYMFRAVLQKSPRVLKHLVCTLMQLDETKVLDVSLLNPIELGKSISQKDCVLDIKASLDEQKIVNIELQMRKQKFWPERSLLYWSRNYDGLSRGEEYAALRETCQIGILGFTLFPENPEFYAEYRIMNSHTRQYYTDKFCIRVLDLTQIDNAKETTDRNLIKWARVIKAKDMEELEALAGDEEVFQKMAVTMKELSEDDKIRMQCEARFFYECDMASTRREGYDEGYEHGIQQGKERILEQSLQIKKKDAEITEKDAKLDKLQQEITALKAQLSALQPAQ